LYLLLGFQFVLDFVRTTLPQAAVETIASLSFYTHFEAIKKGVIDLRDLIFFVAVIGFWLTATVIVLDLKKAD
jgi:ABC-2 type transport system permease protein